MFKIRITELLNDGVEKEFEELECEGGLVVFHGERRGILIFKSSIDELSDVVMDNKPTMLMVNEAMNKFRLKEIEEKFQVKEAAERLLSIFNKDEFSNG